MRWYRRDGRRVSARAVAAAKQRYATAKRIGKIGPLRCSIQPEVADAIDRMTLQEFASHSGMFTWRTTDDT